MSTSTFKKFYNNTATKNWSCIEVINYYRSKLERKDLKSVLDYIKKDLQSIANSDTEFDMVRRNKAQAILDNWKV